MLLRTLFLLALWLSTWAYAPDQDLDVLVRAVLPDSVLLAARDTLCFSDASPADAAADCRTRLSDALEMHPPVLAAALPFALRCLVLDATDTTCTTVATGIALALALDDAAHAAVTARTVNENGQIVLPTTVTPPAPPAPAPTPTEETADELAAIVAQARAAAAQLPGGVDEGVVSQLVDALRQTLRQHRSEHWSADLTPSQALYVHLCQLGAQRAAPAGASMVTIRQLGLFGSTPDTRPGLATSLLLPILGKAKTSAPRGTGGAAREPTIYRMIEYFGRQRLRQESASEVDTMFAEEMADAGAGSDLFVDHGSLARAISNKLKDNTDPTGAETLISTIDTPMPYNTIGDATPTLDNIASLPKARMCYIDYLQGRASLVHALELSETLDVTEGVVAEDLREAWARFLRAADCHAGATQMLAHYLLVGLPPAVSQATTGWPGVKGGAPLSSTGRIVNHSLAVQLLEHGLTVFSDASAANLREMLANYHLGLYPDAPRTTQDTYSLQLERVAAAGGRPRLAGHPQGATSVPAPRSPLRALRLLAQCPQSSLNTAGRYSQLMMQMTRKNYCVLAGFCSETNPTELLSVVPKEWIEEAQKDLEDAQETLSVDGFDEFDEYDELDPFDDVEPTPASTAPPLSLTSIVGSAEAADIRVIRETMSVLELDLPLSAEDAVLEGELAVAASIFTSATGLGLRGSFITAGDSLLAVDWEELVVPEEQQEQQEQEDQGPVATVGAYFGLRHPQAVGELMHALAASLGSGLATYRVASLPITSTVPTDGLYLQEVFNLPFLGSALSFAFTPGLNVPDNVPHALLPRSIHPPTHHPDEMSLSTDEAGDVSVETLRWRLAVQGAQRGWPTAGLAAALTLATKNDATKEDVTRAGVFISNIRTVYNETGISLPLLMQIYTVAVTALCAHPRTLTTILALLTLLLAVDVGLIAVCGRSVDLSRTTQIPDNLRRALGLEVYAEDEAAVAEAVRRSLADAGAAVGGELRPEMGGEEGEREREEDDQLIVEEDEEDEEEEEDEAEEEVADVIADQEEEVLEENPE